MNNEKLLYLDVLPSRPKPLPLESLNSYIKRLAKANGIRQIHAFSQMTMIGRYEFLLNKPRRTSFELLPTITALSEAQLLDLTFYHLGWKFGRHQSLGAFLKNSISPFIRYCPICLEENGYYPLTWNFLCLDGCPQHSVRLLDICGHCGQHIQVRNRCLSLYNCHFCGGDLRLSTTTNLSADEHQLSTQHQDDLIYLLTEQPWQSTQPEVIDAFRQRLAASRLIQKLSMPQLNQLLDIKELSILAIENETLTCTGELFQEYLIYADYFGLTLSQVFKDATQTGYIPKIQLRKNAFFLQVREAVHTLKQQGIPVNREIVADLVGCTTDTLKYYAADYTWLRDATRSQKRRTFNDQEELFQSAQQAISNLNAQKKRVSYCAIAHIMGRDRSQIKARYPNVDTLIREAIAIYTQQHEEELFIRVQQAIHVLAERQQNISINSIAHQIGIPTSTLRYRSPPIRTLIAEEKQRIERQKAQDIQDNVEQVAAQLFQQGIPVTHQTLAQQTGLASHCFKQKNALRAIWQSYSEKQRQQHHDNILQQVLNAIQQLQSQQLPVSQSAIARIVGMAVPPLKHYPRVRQVFKDYDLFRK